MLWTTHVRPAPAKCCYLVMSSSDVVHATVVLQNVAKSMGKPMDQLEGTTIVYWIHL